MDALAAEPVRAAANVIDFGRAVVRLHGIGGEMMRRHRLNSRHSYIETTRQRLALELTAQYGARDPHW